MRLYKRWGIKHFRSKRVLGIRFASLDIAYILRIDLFTHSWFIVYRRNGLQDYYDDISYGYL